MWERSPSLTASIDVVTACAATPETNHLPAQYRVVSATHSNGWVRASAPRFPRSKATHVSGLQISLLFFGRLTNPAICFPVTPSREVRSNQLNYRCTSPSKIRSELEFDKIPCSFPCTQGILAELGSPETATTTNQSAPFRAVSSRRNSRRDFKGIADVADHERQYWPQVRPPISSIAPVCSRGRFWTDTSSCLKRAWHSSNPVRSATS